MATSKKTETITQENTTTTQNIPEDDEVFIAEVVNVYGKFGAGGDVNICKVLVRKTGKTIFRSVQGPVAIGHLLALRECVRESRRAR